MWAIKCWYKHVLWVFEKYTSQEVAKQQLKEYRDKNDLYKDFWVEKYTPSKEQQLREDLNIHKGCPVCASIRLRILSDWTYAKMAKSYNNSMDDEDALSTRITKAIEQAIQALGISITEEEKEALKYHIVRGD